ncbi:MAG: hypothetical protein U0V04_04835 [Spirosomataceae bacterium]|jgi:hypothetical protein
MLCESLWLLGVLCGYHKWYIVNLQSKIVNQTNPAPTPKGIGLI